MAGEARPGDAGVPVHAVESHGEGGDVTTHLYAECPRQGHSVSIDECLVCTSLHAMQVGSDGRHLAVRCDPGAAPPFPPSPANPWLSTRVGDVMTRDLVCLRPEMRVADAAALLRARAFEGAPVVDAYGRGIGMLSLKDVELCVDAAVEQVDSVMTPFVMSLPESAPLARAAALMAYEGVHRIPVVAPDGALVGVVVPADVLRWVAVNAGYLAEPAATP